MAFLAHEAFHLLEDCSCCRFRAPGSVQVCLFSFHTCSVSRTRGLLWSRGMQMQMLEGLSEHSKTLFHTCSVSRTRSLLWSRGIQLLQFEGLGESLSVLTVRRGTIHFHGQCSADASNKQRNSYKSSALNQCRTGSSGHSNERVHATNVLQVCFATCAKWQDFSRVWRHADLYGDKFWRCSKSPQTPQ